MSSSDEDLPDYPTEETPLLRTQNGRSCWIPQYTVATLGCLGMVLDYSQRVDLSIAIVAMVGANSSATNNVSDVCPLPQSSNSSVPQNTETGEFDWDAQMQGVVLGAFFWGYASTNLIGGRIADYLGGKLVFGLGILSSSLFSIIAPICAKASVHVFIACRILMGASQGVTFPAVNTILATWFLPMERSKYSNVVYSGFQLGTVVGLTVSGWLSNWKLFGWESVFYVFGGAGVVWFIAWCAFMYEHPEDHPNISTSYLTRLRDHQQSIKQVEVIAIPWGSIATSVPFWALIIMSLGNDYGFYTLLTELPTYLHDIQHFDLNSNGLLSSLPYLLMWIWGFAWTAVMDKLSNMDKISIVTVRRLSMASAIYGPMLGLITMCFVDCNAILAVAVLCMSGMFNGACNCGMLCSHQDLGPNFAGTLLGITNTVGALAGIAAPVITGFITEGNATLWGWRIVFLLGTGVYLVTATFYIIFISGDVQPWNEPRPLIDKEKCISPLDDNLPDSYQNSAREGV